MGFSSSASPLTMCMYCFACALQRMSMDFGFFDMDMDMDFGGFGSSCVQLDDPEDFPAYQALWTCGLRVRGAAVCVPGEGF